MWTWHTADVVQKQQRWRAGATLNLCLFVQTHSMNFCTRDIFPDILLHSEEGWEDEGQRWLEIWHQLSLLCEPWGVSQNLILWEPLPWQGIPAENGRPHPCHGHSRGPPPLDLTQQRGNTHASLLPTLSSQWVTGPWTGGQFVFGWFLGSILAGSNRLLGQFREVTYCGSLIAPWYVLPSALTGWRHVLLLFTTRGSQMASWCHPVSICGYPRHPADFCLSRREIQQ